MKLKMNRTKLDFPISSVVVTTVGLDRSCSAKVQSGWIMKVGKPESELRLRINCLLILSFTQFVIQNYNNNNNSKAGLTKKLPS